jgi:hypothetical protein
MLGDIKIGFAGSIGVSVIEIGSIEQDHNICVLLEASALTKVRKHRPLVRPLFRAAIEL